MTKRNFITIGIIVVLVILIIIWLVTRVPEPVEEISITEPEETSEPEEIPKMEEAPEIVPPLVTGKQAFDIMTANRTFKIVEVELDPLDVKKEESQQVTVWVEDSENESITSKNKVEGMAFTDNKETPFSFELRQASEANGGTLTEWEGFWILDDTYDKIYIVSIVAKSATQEHKISLTIR